MKIALVSHEYPPFRGGGIGTYAQVMSDALAQAGHEVHVVTNRFDYGSRDPLHARAVHQDGNLWVHRIDALADNWDPKPQYNHPHEIGWQLHRNWSPCLYYAEAVAGALEGICREHQIEVAEFPECAAEGYSVIRRKRRRLGFTDLPITVTLHSPIYEIYRYNIYCKHDVGFQRRAMMEEFCIRNADRVNSPSRLLAQIVYRRLDLPTDDPPCDVIPLPMDFSTLPDVEGPSNRQSRDGALSLLFVGRVEPLKGVKYLVDAAVMVMDEFPSLEVHLVGRDCDAGEAPGSMTEFLRRRIPERLRSRFVFEGLLPREDLFARYAAATACVFAAPWDNFPLTCCEAMASGGCVIASDHTGMAEMVEDGQSGLLFQATHVDSLAAAIRRVLRDPDLGSRLRANARQRIRQVCDPAAAVRNRIAHYEKTIERHHESARKRSVHPVQSGQKIALFLPNRIGEKALLRSIRSARTAAEHADLEIDISVIGTQEHHELTDPPEGVHLDSTWQESDNAARDLWLERVAERPPTYLMTLWPGETLEQRYFAATQAALAQDPTAAWATTWCFPADLPEAVPYAGFDFSVPLELLSYHPVPFALIRYDAYRQVGGWNSDLPPGWCEWDLWLVLEQANWTGIVLPYWLGRYVPRRELGLQPPRYAGLFAKTIEMVVARNAMLFETHGTTLWLDRMVNSVTTLPPEPTAEPGQEWHAWWKLTKTCLKRRFPRSGRAYRRWIKRMPP